MIGIEIRGFEALKVSMARRKQNLQNRTRLNAQAVATVDRFIQKNFESEGSLTHEGTGWAPLAASTIAQRKRNKSGSVKILQDTGSLKSRWKHLYDAKRALVASSMGYGTQHDKGMPHRKPPLPQRRILPREKHIMPMLLKIYKKFVQVAIK